MESTLSLTYAQIQGEVGEFLGYGRGPANNNDSVWTQAQQNDIDSILASGLRNFYFPEPNDQSGSSYNWSFLKPTSQMDFPVNAQIIQLPDDFGGAEGQLTLLTTNSTSMPWYIQWSNEGKIREMYGMQPAMTGPPMFATVRPKKGTAGDRSNRFELFMFPAADQDYTLQLSYYVNPDYLTGAFPYAYGGAPHMETILESCLAVAEQRRDDSLSVHTQLFQRRLAASISMDRRQKPQRIGYNRDQSDQPPFTRQNVHWWAPAATYNGQPFQ